MLDINLSDIHYEHQYSFQVCNEGQNRIPDLVEIIPEGKADTKRIDTQMHICLFTVVTAMKENPCGGS